MSRPAAARPATALRDIEADLDLLGRALDEVARADGGEEVLKLRDATVALARRARAGDGAAGDQLQELIANLGLDRLEALIRSLTRWFQLINLAEDNERVRRIRMRQAREAPAPRRGSIEEAVASMAQRGLSAQAVGALIGRSEIRLVMTAHPTEARRRTTIDKQARGFHELRALDDQLGRDLEQARERIRATVQELWGSDELRAISPTVLDEVRGGLVHFTRVLVDVVPAIHRELARALELHYPDAEIPVGPVLRFGSWIGGDRDGNPFVTPATTVETLALLREQCLRFLQERLGMLAGRLSFSDRTTKSGSELEPILAAGEQHFPALADRLAHLNPEEPYRRAVTFMRERLRASTDGRPGGYTDSAELLADLRTVERALASVGGVYSAAGDLRDVIWQVEVFGFHFAILDIRQHAGVHRRALDEVLREVGVRAGYAQLSDEERLSLLERHIAERRPLIPADISGFSELTRETIETFRMIRCSLSSEHRGAIDSYIISGTEAPADVLEVLLLMKEASLASAGGGHAQLKIAPLFEAGATLRAAPETLGALLRSPAYRQALRSVGNHQEIMVGYSDSNKDVGYLASSWAIYRSQRRIAELLERHDVSWTFFHGRGGTIGRGGGPTQNAILSLPAGTVHGRLKMTEQGEVLTAKYSVGEIAHRELELTVNATLLASASTLGKEHLARPQAVRMVRYEQLLEEMAQSSERFYRAVVHDDPDFVRFFLEVTPVEEVSRLRIGSRPARRHASGGIDELRAIPWVFAWTQARIVLPAWLGLGSALRTARERHGLERLQEMTEHWPFFAAVIANAEMGCARADFGIAGRYVSTWDEPAVSDRIWAALKAEYELTVAELIAIRGYRRLLDSSPVLQASIDRRNPYVDPLSFVQIELRKRRKQQQGDEGELTRLSLLAINGVASGLRGTG
ncbi:MAG: phosphoenolpyruvate carboxylase [Solirubrobacteraceae bacterium]